MKLRHGYPEFYRSEGMGFLAEIWASQGKLSDARELLVLCLQRLLAESKIAVGSDKRLTEEWFQNQRKTFLKVFPSEGQETLSRLGIPESTLS